MPTGVAIIDLADAIVADLSADEALPEAVTVERVYTSKDGLDGLSANTVPSLIVIPAEQADEIDARQVWNEDYAIDVAIRKKLSATEPERSAEMVACLTLLQAVKDFYRLSHERQFVRAEVLFLWSQPLLLQNQVFYGAVRLWFTNEVEIEGDDD